MQTTSTHVNTLTLKRGEHRGTSLKGGGGEYGGKGSFIRIRTFRYHKEGRDERPPPKPTPFVRLWPLAGESMICQVYMMRSRYKGRSSLLVLQPYRSGLNITSSLNLFWKLAKVGPVFSYSTFVKYEWIYNSIQSIFNMLWFNRSILNKTRMDFFMLKVR